MNRCKLHPQIKVELADIIQLLPDNIANQIAAGEVIQRPASAVKELLENAVDAGATEIRLLVNDAGKQLIQVIDNGKGMSITDARKSFERHATSKIRQIDDLFHIRTMGFRGEALASIAAVSQVTLRTRRPEDEMGIQLQVENSRIEDETPVAMPVGTSFSMKNVFFNVPARRNFLKSNAVETRHIIDEFIRVAMSFPDILFSLTTNGQEIFHVEKGSLKQRVVQLLGASYNAKLVNVQEQTDYLNVRGFVGKPETAKKSRGDQYFFVNNRYIRSPYLHHAVMSAYQNLIPAETYPAYVLFIDLDPQQVDVNVHPTKQEIKFEDDKIIYAFVQAAVKHALAQFSIHPSIDFDMDPQIQQLDAVAKPFTAAQQQAATHSSLYQTFTQKGQAHLIEGKKTGLGSWDSFVQTHAPTPVAPGSGHTIGGSMPYTDEERNLDRQLFGRKTKFQFDEHSVFIQILHTYILAPIETGALLIHQQYAHERICYERYAAALVGRTIPVQKSLFPVSIQVSPQDQPILTELLPDFAQLGYLIEPDGQHRFVIHGTPADIAEGYEKSTIEQVLEQYKHAGGDIQISKRERLIRSLAAQHSMPSGKPLTRLEMQRIAQDLFSCAQSNYTPGGKTVYVELQETYFSALFSK
jgi:DNA mismatch repair protein MutL